MTQRRRRLRRSDCSGPGLRRLRRGRGFAYVGEDGKPIDDQEILERVRNLAIPPAWKEVWICADPMGHLQATGIDAAGRKQYLYHPLWRERRDREKFEKMVRFAHQLPRLRRRVSRDVRGEEISKTRVLACAVRLLDVGLFRIGGEEYAEEGGGLGLATVRKEHVAFKDGSMVFDYPAKGGIRRVQAIEEPLCANLIATLKRRRGGGPELLAYRDNGGWAGIRSEDINDYLKAQMGEDFSAKDFRTWNATVLAAVVLAAQGREAQTKAARKRAVDAAVRTVAELLGNTPAVARRAYIDPRVIDRYQSGWTIGGALDRLGNIDIADGRTRVRLEAAVLDLIAEDAESPAVQLIDATE
ncbi:MAG: DNA topoisomerase IB [Solirubrobacterales bacterium]|nr:DNA topoisomerase IB [Solirubrobacterales bacterium]